MLWSLHLDRLHSHLFTLVGQSLGPYIGKGLEDAHPLNRKDRFQVKRAWITLDRSVTTPDSC
jgi:hypothetical protein